MKIVTIVGARPQFIKAAAGSRVFRKNHKEVLVHTGQHFDENMSEVFFREMEIPRPDYNLAVSGGSHAQMTARMMQKIEEVLDLEKPDSVLVYGDTNSTIAGALTAAKMNIPVIHIEAGGRAGTLRNPEEINRIVTDHVSSLRFCSNEDGYKRLCKENLAANSYFVGNIMYDSYLHFADKPWDEPEIVDFDGNKVTVPDHYYLLTCHRQENTGDDNSLEEILLAMNSLDAPTIYPVHPRISKKVLSVCKEKHYDNLILVQPVKYSDSVQLIKHAKKIVTDSGGLQTEAFYAKVQCVFVFEYVVWPETMVGNRNQLAHAHHDDILNKLSKEQVVDPEYMPFGDGHAAEKICEIINRWKPEVI